MWELVVGGIGGGYDDGGEAGVMRREESYGTT